MKKHFALVALALSTVTMMSSAHAAYEKSQSFASKPASQEVIAMAAPGKTPCMATAKGTMYDNTNLMHDTSASDKTVTAQAGSSHKSLR